MDNKSRVEIEIDILLKTIEEPTIKDFIPEILAIVDKFRNSGQSGGSAPYTAHAISETIKKLCLHKTLTPLTGKDDEWEDISHYGDGNTMFQNNRDSTLFKDENGKCYSVDAIIWQGEDEYDTYHSIVDGFKSIGYIKKFPFIPKTFYIDTIRVDYDSVLHGENWYEDGNGRKYVNKIKDMNQIFEVYEYYELDPNNIEFNKYFLRSKKLNRLLNEECNR